MKMGVGIATLTPVFMESQNIRGEIELQGHFFQLLNFQVEETEAQTS